MAKTKTIQVLAGGCIHYGDDIHLPGTHFDCEAKEAARLVKLGVAVPFSPALTEKDTLAEQEQAALAAAMQAQAALIDQIRAAADLDALNALVDPATETRPAVIDAYTERADELEGAAQ